MNKEFDLANFTFGINIQRNILEKNFTLPDANLLYGLKKIYKTFYDLNQSLNHKTFKKINVLIIDDDAFIVETVSKILQLRGHCVYTADTINRGLAIYQNMTEKIDLVILNLVFSNNVDYRLTIPGLLSINNKIKIIGVNKSITENELPLYFKQSLFGFLNSPFIIRDLLKIINNFNKPAIFSIN